ncbi:cytosine permease [Streptomyces sp. NPDC047072]|uniref:purine-cytosine permease family protein n=1 Tax=Streptomyces sp. NPDC047072 TaxID=3154809 RepID=UPI0034004246
MPGPRAGTTTFMVNRTIMGVPGNRLLALFNWLMQVGYQVLDTVLMALAATSLLGLADVRVSEWGQVGVIVLFSAVQSTLPLMGHALITRVLNLLAAPFAVVFLLLAWLTADRFDYVSTQPSTLSVFLGGVALIASASGLGWTPNATDLSRYLPADTKPSRVVAAVALGGAVPQILLMVTGACVATVTPAASDPVSGLSGTYPTWFIVTYLVLLIVQLAALNGVNCYSSGLTLQAAGLPFNRWQAVLLDTVVCTVLAAVVTLSGDFYSAVSDFLLFSIVWFAPWSAIYVLAHLLRRGDHDLGHQPRTWTAGLTAQLLGMTASALWLVTGVWSGWLAHLTDDTDLSVLAGLLVGGGCYWLLARRTERTVRTA